MRTKRIQYLIKVPENISDEDIEAWARYMVGDKGKLSDDNPLYDESFEPVYGTFKIEDAQ